MERKSSRVARDLKKLPGHQQTQMIRMYAAAEGLTDRDLVEKALGITGPNGPDQLEEVAKFWAPRLGLSVARFKALAGEIL